MKFARKLLIFSMPVFLLTQCDLLNTSLEQYLREIPEELQLSALWAEYNSLRYEPLEPLAGDRDSFTIVITPFSPADEGPVSLNAAPAAPASRANSESWNAPPRPIKIVEGYNFTFYRPDETKYITVTAPSGVSKTYHVKIVWAKLIDHPDEIRTDPSGDYYLKSGPKIVLNNWTPIGTDDAYASPGIFSGSLRGNGRTIEINSFKTTPTSSPVEAQGLFVLLSEAVVEELHLRLNSVQTNTKNAGGITGISRQSLIHQVKVSGSLSNILSGTETVEINAGAIAGTLASGAMIANSIAAADITGFVPSSYGGTNNYYLGGAAGRQLHTPAASPYVLNPGGYIIKTLVLGNVITNTGGGKHSVAGGITGGGGDTSNTDIKGCVAAGHEINAGLGGVVNYILGQWGSPGTSSVNYCSNDISKVGYSPIGSIEGTPIMRADLETNQAIYSGLGWDFTGIWKMGSGGYPALIWE
jgi:hypothetical protein